MGGQAGASLAAAAKSLVGTRFRLHGRDPAHGLDCVGLIGEALRRIGRQPMLPRGYRLRMRDPAPWLHFAAANGLSPVTGIVAGGDVFLVHFHQMQPHLLVAMNGTAFVHAHAVLGRVVCQAAPYPSPVIGHWRLDEKG